MNKTQTSNNKEELGALWKKKSKNGMSFLSGYVKVDDLGLDKEVKIVVFANNNKSNEKAPDYRIYVSKPLGVETTTATAKTNSTQNKDIKKSAVVISDEAEQDDIL